MNLNKPTLVLLPGFDGTGKLFDGLINELGNNFNIVAINYCEEVTIEAYLTCINEKIGQNKQVILLAESFSGPIALHFITNHSDKIKCCIFSTSFSKTPFLSLCKAAVFLPDIFFQSTALQKIAIKYYCYGKYFTNHLGERTLKAINSISANTVKKRLKLLCTQQSHKLIKDKNHNIFMPCLYLQASEDKIVRKSLASDLCNALPNVNKVTINGPHLLLQTKPKECASAILDFVNKANLQHGY